MLGSIQKGDMIAPVPHPAGGSGSVSESTEPVKSAFKWSGGFDINKPKEPQDTQTQEHDNEDTTTSNVNPEHDSPGFTDIFLGPDEAIDTEVGSTERLEIPEEYFHRSKETLQSLSTWYLGPDTDKPKEPQDPQTQEQGDEDITTLNVGPGHDSSDSTGAATGSDEATNTNVHQEEENEGSTAEQTQAEVHREDSPEPEETVQTHLNWLSLHKRS
ncbi:hypothetical protein BASA62_010321 [Batrachochytrium salamandrivorans]|nr:hypothetical protein BASA62_010321 [Batrachochytrium salamandrivorans]